MNPQRIILILPCCIGDVVLGTAALAALRRAYPAALIDWAVGSWSRAAIEGHPALNGILDTGADANPVKTRAGMARFVRQLRAGNYDLAVSLSRSPLMSLAVLLSRIPVRAGLNSGGRGFGYTVRAKIDPNVPRHEAEIYLDVVHALGIDTTDCHANVPVTEADYGAMCDRLAISGIFAPHIVINPAGGRNPGMVMDAKRYPPDKLAALTNRLVAEFGAYPILIGGKDDAALIDAVRRKVKPPNVTFAGALTFGEIGALAADALVYIGNDTGLTHYAAASGARTVMIMGPTDPRRYAPFAPNALALWKTADVPARGVAAGVRADWDWSRDGIGVEDALTQIMAFLRR
ncbi:MAG: glycosyltransferase family 9 protein [Chloroflexota bacterium]|nr:glycosyltransferase family 9 protein [Chloroflexota bacterium]